MELSDAIERFLKSQRTTTANSYRPVLYRMRDWIGPARPLASIRPDLLSEYFADQIQNAGYARATENKHAKTMKTFFNWCVKAEYIDKSPAFLVKVAKLPRHIDRHKAMAEDEFDALADFMKWKPRDYALLLFIADTGCRRSGAAGLRVRDLDLPNNRATVTEKGDKMRMVWYGDDCRDALRRWLVLKPRGAGAYVFSRDGKSIKPEAISLILRRASQAIGIRSLGPHSLRHRKGYQFADSKIAPSIAATALGHEDVEITLRHYYPSDIESAEREIRKLSTKRRHPMTPPNVVDLPKDEAI